MNIISRIKEKIKLKDVLIFSIPFFSFLVFLSIYHPGILSYDSYEQLKQIHTSTFNSWHPFFHTFIEMICLKIYDSPISVCLLQIFVFSSLWTMICKYNRSNEKKIFDKQYVLQLVITLLIVINPINDIYAITLWKDILYSYALLLFCFLISDILKKNYLISNKLLVITAITMAFVYHLRPNGKYIVIIMVILLGVLFYKNNKKEKIYLKLPILSIVFIVMIFSLNIIYHVRDNEKDALETKIAHFLSYYALNVKVEKKDQKIINTLVSLDKLDENFNIYFSDDIYKLTTQKNNKESKGKYIGIILKYSLKYPLNAIEYLFTSSEIVWKITDGREWKTKVYNTDISSTNNTENYTPKNIGRKRYQLLNDYVYYFSEHSIMSTLFFNPALYMYLSIIILIILKLFYKKKGMLYIYLPNLLNSLIVFVSTPVQDYRYLYSNILIFYMLIIYFIHIVLKSRRSL